MIWSYRASTVLIFVVLSDKETERERELKLPFPQVLVSGVLYICLNFSLIHEFISLHDGTYGGVLVKSSSR
jgi:hypothetical protein